MVQFLRSFVSDPRGATAIEYAGVAVLAAIVIFLAINEVGANVEELYQRISDAVT